jgi:hypothetical protein
MEQVGIFIESNSRFNKMLGLFAVLEGCYAESKAWVLEIGAVVPRVLLLFRLFVKLCS